MTVTYTLDISTASFCSIHRLLLRWKGSVWKAVLPELLLWILMYFVISSVYRFLLSKEQQVVFEDVAEYCYTYSSYIPITFMLGFYVKIVHTRWSNVFDNLGWIDNSALLVTTAVKGTDEAARNIRRNIIRYVVLVQALVFRSLSSNVKRRFPTMDHLVTAGLMTPNELREFDEIVSPQMKYWVPINWCYLLCRKARDLNMIDSDIIFVDVMDKIRMFRQNVLTLTLYDMMPLPLLYTQTVNLTVRTYFIIGLMARQYLLDHDRDTPNAKTIDMYFPIFTVLQFLFFIGWMKVAEVMLNPLGDDDDDFETNWILDRNLQVGLLIADSHGRLPKIERDMFWEDILPRPLYTSESVRPHNYVGSCQNLHVPPQKQKLSELLTPNKWFSKQDINRDSDEITMIPPAPSKLMSTETVSTDDLRYVDAVNEVPVIRSNERRRESVLDPELEVYSKNNKLVSTLVKKLARAHVSRSRLKHDFSKMSLSEDHSNDLLEDAAPESLGQRRYSDITHLNPSDLNALMAQLAKTDDSSEGGASDSTSSLNRSTSSLAPAKTWTVVNETMPVIQEEERGRSAFPSKASSAVPSQAPSWSNLALDFSTFPEPSKTDDLSPPVKESFERLRTLLRNESFTSTSSANVSTPGTQTPRPAPRGIRPEFEYENLGFDGDWEESAGPEVVQPQFGGHPPRPRTNPRSRPGLRTRPDFDAEQMP